MISNTQNMTRNIDLGLEIYFLHIVELNQFKNEFNTLKELNRK